MDLKHKIIFERISALDQLESAEREQVAADDVLLQLLEENRGLGGVRPVERPAPPMQAMLEQTYLKADNHKENIMFSVSRILMGKPWYLKVALAGAFTLAVIAAFLLMPNLNGSSSPAPAWGATEGHMLVYEFGNIGPLTCEEGPTPADSILKSIDAAIRGWGESRRADDPEAEPVKVEIMAKVQNENLVVTLALSETGALLDELKDVIAQVPGMPEPTVTDATWFFLDKGSCAYRDGLEIDLGDHLFTFPPSATEEEIESEITKWFYDNKDGRKVNVDVEIITEGEKKRVEVKITTGEGK